MGNTALASQAVITNELKMDTYNVTNINGYNVTIKHSDKSLLECMKNVIRLTLAK